MVSSITNNSIIETFDFIVELELIQIIVQFTVTISQCLES